MAQSVFGGQLSSPVTGGLAVSSRGFAWGFAKQLGVATVTWYVPGMPGSYRRLGHGIKIAKAGFSKAGKFVGSKSFEYASKKPYQTAALGGALHPFFEEGLNRQFNPFYVQGKMLGAIPVDADTLKSMASGLFFGRRGGDPTLSSGSGPRPFDPTLPFMVMRTQVPKIPLGRGGTLSNAKIISKHKRLPGVGTKRQTRRPQSPYCWVHRKQHWCRITRS